MSNQAYSMWWRNWRFYGRKEEIRVFDGNLEEIENKIKDKDYLALVSVWFLAHSQQIHDEKFNFCLANQLR